MGMTLANQMRPLSLQDVLGQSHIKGENALFSQFIKKQKVLSTILYGNPGCGKTTLAIALANDLQIPYRLYNATTSNKKDMEKIIEEAKIYKNLLFIIDEVHRLNKDKQDHLLSYIESGIITIIGCTTANPYHSINPAIRSRCQIIEVLPLEKKDIIEGLNKALTSEKGLNNQYQVEEGVIDYIASLSQGDLRFAYNALEVASILTNTNLITKDIIKQAIPRSSTFFDKNDDHYYDTLSGLQKSIRGSDPNGAMYYLAKLIDANDIESLERRVITTAYEDIGLANPQACMRTVVAFQAAKTIGFPEARIPIAQAIIDLCLSPKSKSAEHAIDKALSTLNKHNHPAPNYLRLSPVGIQPEDLYDYSKPETWEYIQYLPEPIKNEKFYIPWMSSAYEKALGENYKRILKHGRTSQIRKLNEKIKR